MNQIMPKGDMPLQRFELADGDRLYGFVDYYPFGDIAVITHTEVNPALEGRGHGKKLAAKAMEYLHAEGKRVVPVCGFIAHYLRTHPQHHDLVTPASRSIFNIGPPLDIEG